MASRVGGTVLALTATGLLAITLATGAWWSGHPNIDGRVIAAKTVHIGVLVAEGCNTGGDGACKALDIGGGFNATRYAVAGASVLCLLVTLGIAALTLAYSNRRKLLAWAAFGAAAVAAVTAVLLLVQSPDLKTSAKVSVPLGWGMYLFGGAVAATVASGIAALRPLPPRPRPVLAPPGWSGGAAVPSMQPPMQSPMPPAMQPPAPAPFDRAAVMQDSALRPAPPPAPYVPPSPGGMLPGPSGPLAPPTAPLFSSAPQLRALYDAGPAQGGTGGFVPQPPAPPPMRPPTPIPRASISAVAGIPTPPPLEVPPPLPPRSKTLPPPPRSKPLTAAPPPRPAATPTRPPPLPMPTPVPAPPPKIAFPPLPPREPTADLDAGFDEMATSLPPPKPVSPFAGNTELSDHDEPMDTSAQAALAVGDSTDMNQAVGESFDSSTSEQRMIDEALARDAASADAADAVAPTTAFERPSTATEMGPPPAKPLDALAAALVAPNPMQSIKAASVMKVPTIPPIAGPKPPISTAPDSLPPPEEKQAATSGPSPACPQCEAPMAWVEAHLRFYCKSCKMYF